MFACVTQNDNVSTAGPRSFQDYYCAGRCTRDVHSHAYRSLYVNIHPYKCTYIVESYRHSLTESLAPMLEQAVARNLTHSCLNTSDEVAERLHYFGMAPRDVDRLCQAIQVPCCRFHHHYSFPTHLMQNNGPDALSWPR